MQQGRGRGQREAGMEVLPSPRPSPIGSISSPQLHFGNYTVIEQLYASKKTKIYRARMESPLASEVSAAETFIIKTLTKDHPSLADLAPLLHEYKILNGLAIEGVIRVISLESFGNGFALVLSDFEGVTLDKVLEERSIDVEELVDLAIDLVRVIGEVHASGVIHKDIKPSNIKFNHHTRKIQLIDFGISSRLTSVHYHHNTANLRTTTGEVRQVMDRLTAESGRTEQAYGVLVGTIAYMSPEQTGRMNCVVDYRSDLYSLGVTLFELATRRLPFEAAHRLEYIHCHMAKRPPRADEFNPKLPRPIADMIEKLLAKSPEDRYQSAEGLLADLRMYRSVPDAEMETFVAGRMDLFSRFALPHKLYGRENEVTRLLSAFDRMATSGECEVVMVRGYSGMGKSSIVHEVQKPIVRKGGGCFVSGKFDQYHRGTSSLVVAFRDLVRHLLSEGPQVVNEWKRRILDALGTNGQLLIDVLPELEKVIGKQPAVPEVGPAEAENRFNMVFTQFVGVFCREEHPLTLFLDDLQWADSTSLQLVSLILCKKIIRYLLVIGAYRDNEVTESHPVVTTIAQMQRENVPLTDIEVIALTLDDVQQLVCDTTRCQLEDCRELSELLHAKTAGNPFFVSHLLKDMHQEGQVKFRFDSGRWEWRIDDLRQHMGITANVVDLMVRQIHKLSPESQRALQVAAAIGNKFSLRVLSVALARSANETAQVLWSALSHGLVVPMSDIYNVFLDTGMVTAGCGELNAKVEQMAELCIYRFLHDRVQQAAYSMIADGEGEELHLMIGRRLLQAFENDKLERHVHSIVEQLNAGSRLIAAREEKERLARLNFGLGKKARAATAYQAAVKYLDQAVKLIASDEDMAVDNRSSSAVGEDSCWHRERHSNSMALFYEAAQAHFLNADFDGAGKLCSVMLRRAKTLMETVAVHEQQMLFLSNRHLLGEAMDIGLKLLDLLGVKLVTEPPRLAFTEDEVDGQPEMTDEHHLATMRVLTALFAPAGVRDPKLNMYLPFTMIDMTNRHGTCALSAFGAVYYGTICVLDDAQLGLKAGKLAMRLQAKFKAAELTSKIYTLFYGMIAIWHMPYRSILEPLRFSKRAGLEVGDHEWAGHSGDFIADTIMWSGERLEVVNNEIEALFDDMVARGLTMQGTYTNIWRRHSLILLNREYPESYQFFGRTVTDEVLETEQREGKMMLFWFSTTVARGVMHYYRQEWDKAIEYLQLANEIACNTIIDRAICRYFGALALLQGLRRETSMDTERAKQFLEEVKEHQKFLKGWATNAPINYMHKFQLVQAELYAVQGKHAKAMDLYDEAIQGALRNEFTMDEALAKELAGDFYCRRGQTRFGGTYLRDAYYAWARWGSVIKIDQLEIRLKLSRLATSVPERVSPPSPSLSTQPNVRGESTGSATARALSAVIKTSQAVLGETRLDKLLDHLMRQLLETTGATRCVLLRAREGRLIVEANAVARKDPSSVICSHPAQSNDVVVEQDVGVPLTDYAGLPHSAIELAWKKQELLIIDDPMDPSKVVQRMKQGLLAKGKSNEPRCKWLVCSPVVHLSTTLGALYLESTNEDGSLQQESLWLLAVVSTQIGISLKNAQLFSDLRQKTKQLKKGLHQMSVTQSDLREAMRLAQAAVVAKNNFMANISYETRIPLTAVLGASDLLGGTQLNEEQREWLGIVEFAGKALYKLIEDILDFARLEHGVLRIEKSSFELRQWLHDTIALFQNEATEKCIRMILEVDPDCSGHIHCDRDRLGQVLRNLLSNAIKFTPSGGWIKIIVKERTASEKERQGADAEFLRPGSDDRDSSRWLDVTVEDSGQGISDELRGRLFEPFTLGDPTLSRTTGGAGIGLAFSKQLLQLLGGTIGVETARVGRGARFTFAVPTQV